MFSDEMAKERIADRLREAERERLARSVRTTSGSRGGRALRGAALALTTAVSRWVAFRRATPVRERPVARATAGSE